MYLINVSHFVSGCLSAACSPLREFSLPDGPAQSLAFDRGRVVTRLARSFIFCAR